MKFIKDMLTKEYTKRGIRVQSIEDTICDTIKIPDDIRTAYCEEVKFLKKEMGDLVKVIATIEVHLEK